ncbi:gelsolin [Elysia marginata]|uniref:Actin-modulator n=1 Tax=Elysia marginata TaxID=1093978 RepID=A0AAV4JVX6_9GAST|nr:gelsolin [Elysia marginata]
MAGLVKAKKYDWKDSNMALFGSDTERAVKKASAECEPAWQGAGQEVGIKIWRIEKFEVKDWPKEDYGEFYNGDSYIILNTYKEEGGEEFLYDLHFWIGKNSSQDEYGTAAYKTVELDTFLGDLPVQHRECQGHESPLFKSYFPDGITTMEGGCATGFRSVPDVEAYEPRLFRYKKDSKGHICVREIPRNPDLVTQDDVFILDLGNKLYQFNGDSSSVSERSKAMQWIIKVRDNRGGDVESEVLDGSGVSKSHEFYEKLDSTETEEDDDGDGNEDKKLLRVNMETAESEVVKEGEASLSDLASDDVFIVDSGETVFVWVGANASQDEKKNGLPYAHNYLRGNGSPWRSVTVIKEGQKCPQFTSALAA